MVLLLYQSSWPAGAFEHFMRDSRKINAGGITYQVIIGKSNDDMSFQRTH
jgi:hypothetical protein